METIALIILFWAWFGPIIAIWQTGAHLGAVVMALLSIWAIKNRGQGGCLIMFVWFVWSVIALFSVGGGLAISVLFCWLMIFFALGSNSY